MVSRRSAEALVFAAFACLASDSWAKVDVKVERWLGRKTIGILEAGDRVEVFTVGETPVGRRGYADQITNAPFQQETPAAIQRYPVRRVAASQDRAFAQQIARPVLDEHSYEPRMFPFGRSIAKGCILRPGVAFRVWARKQAVDVLLCFHCDQVAIAPADGSKQMLSGDIDPARAAFVRLAKQALPDIPEIAKLSEVRPN